MVVPRGKFDSTNQKHYPVLVINASSVWNFCARFSVAGVAGVKIGLARARGAREGERTGTPARTPLFSRFSSLRGRR